MWCNMRSITSVSHLRPREPVGAVVSVVKGLVGGPAALLLVEPEGLGADPEAKVGHPAGADVDHASERASYHTHLQARWWEVRGGTRVNTGREYGQKFHKTF